MWKQLSKKLLKNLHSASLPPQSLEVFALNYFMIESIIISNTKFDKVQGKVYVELNGKICQVKEKFSFSAIQMEVERFKTKINNGK